MGSETVDSIMTRGVFTLTRIDKMAEAVRIFAAHDVGTVVVVDDEQLVGILTERDVVRALAKSANTLQLSLGEVMSSPVVTVPPSAELSTALKLMVEKRIRRLPVTQRGKLVGIVTARDLLRWSLIEVSPAYRLKQLSPEELARVLSDWE